MKNNKKTAKKKLVLPLPMFSPFDPLGSWTGIPNPGEYEIPVQDADDL